MKRFLVMGMIFLVGLMLALIPPIIQAGDDEELLCRAVLSDVYHPEALKNSQVYIYIEAKKIKLDLKTSEFIAQNAYVMIPAGKKDICFYHRKYYLDLNLRYSTHINTVKLTIGGKRRKGNAIYYYYHTYYYCRSVTGEFRLIKAEID